MVNVEWCHPCNQPECRMAMHDCEHGRKAMEREAKKCEPGTTSEPAHEFDWSWTDEDPGTCAKCGEPFELVRPGKSQPTCACWSPLPEEGWDNE